MSETKPTSAELKSLFQADYAENLSGAQKHIDLAGNYALGALKSLFLVNGGAILALLTFLGNGGDLIEKISIFWSFIWLTCGVCTVIIAYISAFFSQTYLMQTSFIDAWNSQALAHVVERRPDDPTSLKKGECWSKFAVICAIGSLIFFIVGAFVALDAIT